MGPGLCGLNSAGLLDGAQEAIDFGSLRRGRGKTLEQRSGFPRGIVPPAGSRIGEREVEARLMEIRVERYGS